MGKMLTIFKRPVFKTSRQLKSLMMLLLIIGAMCNADKLLADGSPQFRPDTTKATNLMIINNQTTYGTFAGYSATADNRLYVRINNPSQERIYFGIGQRSSNTNWYVRIKDPNGNTIFGPQLLPTTTGSTGFIAYHKQAIAGPSVVNPQGYNGFNCNPTSGLAGDYYIEFNRDNATTVSNNTELNLGIFDVSVVNTSSNTIVTGRLFSKNWSFNTESYANPFYGYFYIYGQDSSVTKVDMNGIKPYKFRVSCNRFGTSSTGNATTDRRSKVGFAVPVEFKLFLTDPDVISYPSGTMQFLTGPPTFERCVKDSICINVGLTKTSDVTVVIDRNNNNKFDPGTADRRILFTQVPAGNSCLYWDGKDGFGNQIPVGNPVSVILSVESGLVNLPMFDVENHETGFSMSVIRPGTAMFVDSLFYDDVLVGGTTNLSGCAFPCHTWTSNPPNTDQNTIGENNTINTWWFAHKMSQKNIIALPDYLVNNAGSDITFCAKGGNLDSVPFAGTIAYTQSAFTGSVKWTTSGSGQFYPNDSVINGVYIPSAADINAGSVMLIMGPKNVCADVKDTLILNLRKSPVVALSPSHINCFGQATGSIATSVSNSVAPYSYSWSNGSSSQNLSNVVAGNYTVTVTSSQGCSTTASASLTQPSASLSATAAATAVGCYGANTGAINLTVNGGTAPYSYVWSNGASTQNISGLTAGNYTATITDANGCVNTQSGISITQPAAALSISSTKTNVSCFGGSNGTINLTVSGGTMPYTYLWNTGATSASVSGLAAGNYTVTVTDGNSCTASQASISISQPAAALNATATANPVNCFGNATGSINLSVSGGTTPYSFVWSNGSTTQNLSGVVAGTYSVTVTDAKGCTSAQSAINVNQPGAALSSGFVVTPVACYGQATGSILLNVNGGTAPYSFQWNTGATSQNLNNITTGTYSVSITDANGCTAAQNSITVSQPSAALTANASATAVNCYGNATGAIALTVGGGTTPYSFNWSNGATTQNLTNITAGNYSVTVTDANGCTAVQTSVAVSQPSAALNSSVGTTQNVNCFGNTTGAINLNVTGGTTPYAFVWSNGATTQNLTNIAAGTYTVTVTDAKGCTNTTNAIQISQPSAGLNASVQSTQNVSCNGGGNGALVLTVNGGTSPYTFLWSNGATTQNISGLNSGIYNVTITDSKGCTLQTSGTVSQPANALSATIAASQEVYCYGGSNGFINLSVSGGTSPYTFNWSNGATSQNLTGLSAGAYSVTITDANGCIYSISKTITQPSGALSATLSAATEVSCYGLSNGNISTSITGGTTPYSFVWSNGATTQNISGLAAGTYTLTVTDANGCSTSMNKTVTQPTAALAATVASSQNVNCFGGNNASINVSVTGGTTPYAYNWSNGASTQNINALSAGNYTVTVTDANNCTTTLSQTITQPAQALAVSVAASQNVNCFGGNNASITLTTTGGTAPYSYNWSNGATSQNISGLASGTYTVTVTDANGCVSNTSHTISQPSQALSGVIAAFQNVSCYNISNGSITANANGGTPNYTYQWNNGATTPTINGLASGTYTVTITDANGCTTQLNKTISQPSSALNVTVASSSNVSCFGQSNGSINLSVTGGTSPYTFSWNNGETTQNISGLITGTYTVSVADANGCTTTQSVTISQPSQALNASIASSQNVNCFGGNNASIALTVNGGTGPYTYNWSNGATTQNISSLTSGTYSVTVTDANGCTVSLNKTITQPIAALNATVTGTQNATCYGFNNGSITVTVSGGTSPYSYAWSNGATSQNLTNVAAGTYSVTITDANGCTSQLNGMVISQPSASLASSINTVDVLCHGQNTGSITTTASGGTAPYTYLWNTGATTSGLNNIAAGTYSVSITDAQGCTVAQNAIVVEQPSQSLDASVASNVAVLCHGGNNGAISLTVTGGTAPYSYNWSNGATTQNLTSIVAGVYTVTITDAHGCTKSINGILVNQPDNPLTTSIASSQNVACNGGGNGSLTLNVGGGTLPYTFNWSNGATTQNINGLYAGTYNVSITDANGCTATATGIVSQPSGALTSSISSSQNILCYGGTNGTVNLSVSGGTVPYSYNWSNGATTQNLNNLAAGNYAVTVTDANGCISQSSVVITQPIGALNATLAASQNILCFAQSTGQIDITVTGGTAPFTYLWSNGATTQDLNNIPAGTYSVSISDANGCTFALNGLILTQPSGELGVTPQVNALNCYDVHTGSITLSVTGGTAPYTYNWSNGATTQNVNNIGAGTYSVTVTDANGCSAAATSLQVTQPSAALSTTYSAQNIGCYGQNTGAINVTVSGGTAPYSYNWSNGATSQNISNIPAGTYTLSVTDANGCTATTGTISLSQPAAALSHSFTTTEAGCFGNNTGGIDLTVTGGTAPYSYNWSNGATSQDLSGIAAGTYVVTITDANGCNNTSSTITVSQPAGALNASLASSQNINCFGNNTGSITLTVNGGTTPYSYNWSNGATTQNISNIPAGVYSVTITDANGCSNMLSGLAITQPAGALAAGINSLQNVNCFGQNTGGITLNVNGGTAPYSYNWSNGAITQNLSNISAGVYSVTVTDANNCTTSIQAITINEPAAILFASVNTASNVSCNGGSNGSIDVNVSGGTTPYTYSWSNGATTQDISGLSSGSYALTITDANGCTFALSEVITQPAASLASSINSSQNINCYGNATGAIDLTVSGGTSPYTYNWSNGATTQDISAVTSGTYTVSVTDANGCTSQQTITLTQPTAALSTSINNLTNVNCYGQATAAILINVNGGTTPYSYMWSDGSTNQNLIGVSAGTYSVTVTDANGCTASMPGLAISQPGASLSATVTSTQNVACTGGGNGAIDITVSGGTTPYNFVWSNGATSEDISNLATGTYTVTITDDNGCDFTLSENVGQPASNLATSIQNVQHVDCFSNATGSIDLNASGGTLPYTFNWSNGATSEDISGLTSGIYTVTVTDANGCYNIQTATISQPSASLSTSISGSQNILCYGNLTGSIDLTVSGGTTPYTYIWSNGNTTEDLSAIGAGTYSVTVTDANNCSAQQSITLTQPSASLTTAITSTSPVLCYGGNTGSANLDIQGGTTPYTILWSNGSSSQNQSNLMAGNYTVLVTDANGCSSNESTTITQPQDSISGGISAIDQVLCYGNSTGNIDITVNGGTAPYQYVWNSGQTTQDLQNITAGYYEVLVTDQNGCTWSINATVGQPSATLSNILTLNNNVSCFGGNNGSITANTNGGTAPYTYNWSNGASTSGISNLAAGWYTVTITDANGCSLSDSISVQQPSASLSGSYQMTSSVSCFGGNDGAIDATITGGTMPYTYQWSNGDLTEDLTGVAAGNYTLSVTDANGCTFNLVATVTQPSGPLSPSVAITPVGCFADTTGAIYLNVSGGTPPYLYYWSNGATTQNLLNMHGGSYSVFVVDSNNCVAQAGAYIPTPEGAIEVHATVAHINCQSILSGSIILQTTGGTPPYTFAWSNGATTQDLLNIGAGTYTVTVTDSAGCTYSESYTINGPTQALALTGQKTDINCHGNSTGSASVNVTGGIPPYSYVWTNGQTTPSVNNLTAGLYKVIVTDSYNCSIDTLFEIKQPDSALVNQLSATQIACYGQNNGSIQVSTTGGTPAYSYLWNNGATTASINNLVPGIYALTVTDQLGCTDQQSVTIGQPAAALQATSTANQSNCLTGTGADIDLSVSGGTSPYTYAWSNGSTYQDLTNIGAGTYTVSITDANGCTYEQTQVVTDVSVFNMNANGPTEFCVGGNVTLNATSVQNGVYQWYVNGQALPGATTSSLTTPAAGVYTVSLTNACGNFMSGPVEVKVNSVSNYTVSPNMMICPSNGEIAQLYATGGSWYSWHPGQGLNDSTIANPIATPKASTTYTVTIRSNEGCEISTEVLVSVICDTLFVPTGFSPDGNTVNDTYVIDGLSKYPGNILYIYNRWGNLVYKKRDYDNTWDGTSNVAGVYLGQQLPNGTYYFILDLNDGKKPMQGYLTLKR
jgi:gliding motility-associated-like protein